MLKASHLSAFYALQGARAKLSQDLVALWGEGCAPAAALLRRTFPPGLLRFLSLGRPPPAGPAVSGKSRTAQPPSRQQPQQPPPNFAGPSDAGMPAGRGAAAALGAQQQAADRSGIGAPAQPDPLRGAGSAAANGALSSPRSSVNSPRGAPSARSDAGSSGTAASERRTAGSLDGVARPPGQPQHHRPRSAGAAMLAGLRTAGFVTHLYR